MSTIIKIVEKSTGKVVKTFKFLNERQERAFFFWWSVNGNSDSFKLVREED